MPNASPQDSDDTLVLNQFLQEMDQVEDLVNQAETHKGTQIAIEKRKMAIMRAIKAFKVYSNATATKKIFLPKLEQFVLSLISENLYLLKQAIGYPAYHASFGDEGVKIEVYLNQFMSLFRDYEQCDLLHDRVRKSIIAAQKNPLKNKINWEELRLYRKELLEIQERFKQYKFQLNDQQNWLEPLDHFAEILKGAQASQQVNLEQPQEAQTIIFDEIQQDVYALNHIISYLNVALPLDLDKEKEWGEAVIERALQVTGEYFKNTKESPHLSDLMQKKLKDLGVSIRHLTELRDLLSHSGSFICSVRQSIKQNKLPLLKKVQKDLEKIKIVVLKILYRTELKQIKNLISEVKLPVTSLGIQSILDDIKDKQNLGDIRKELENICQKLINSGNSLLIEKGNAFKAIILRIDLKQIRVNIEGLEEKFKNNKELSQGIQNEIQVFEAGVQAAINELYYFKQNHIIPSKSTITSISETEGISELSTLHKTRSAEQTRKLTIIYDEFIQHTFQSNEWIYRKLKPELAADNFLLREEIRAIDTNLSEEALDKLIEVFAPKYRLMHAIALNLTNKDKFFELLEQLNYGPIPENKLYLFAVEMQPQLDHAEKKLLEDCLFEFHQNLFLNKIFDTYFDSLLFETETKISPKEYENLVNNIEKKKQFHHVKTKLLDFFEGNLVIATREEYDALIDQLLGAGKIKKTIELKAYFSTFSTDAQLREKAKNLMTSILDTYGALLKAIKENESITSVSRAFERFSTSLDLPQNIKKDLDVLFKENEQVRFEKFFLERLNQLNKVVELKNDPTIDKKSLVLAAEMLLLDVDNIWENLLKASAYSFVKQLNLSAILLVDLSLPEAFSLRNYLAHGDTLIDVLKPNFFSELIKNIPQLIQDGEALIALKQLLGDSLMQDYLVQEIVDKKRIVALDETVLPVPLQKHKNAIKTFKKSPRWTDYLKKLEIQPAASVVSINQDYVTTLMQIFDSELREAAGKNDLIKLEYCLKIQLDSNSEDERGWNSAFYAVEGDASEEVFKILQKKGVLFNHADHTGGTPIHYAAFLSRQSSFIFLKSQSDSDFHVENNEGFNPFQLAIVRNAHPTIIKEFLDKAAKLGISGVHGWSPFLLAASFRHKDLVHQLGTQYKDKVNIDEVNKRGLSALILATLNNDSGMLEELIEQGVQRDQLSNRGWSALHIAAFKGYVNLMKMLCAPNTAGSKPGANVNLRGKGGATPLHFAVREHRLSAVEYLLRQPNIEVNVIDNEGKSPWLSAVVNEKIDMMKVLLTAKEKLNINLAGDNAWTALHIAVALKNEDMVDLLLKEGANVHVKNVDAATPSYLACRQGHLKILQALRNSGADLSCKTQEGWTHLQEAASRGHVEIVHYLLENNLAPDSNDLNNKGFAAIHIATTAPHINVLAALLQSNHIDINLKTAVVIKTETGNVIQRSTASHWAVTMGYLDVLKLLKEKGADLSLTTSDTKTHLHLAAQAHKASEEDRLEILNYLLENSAPIEEKTKYGSTALHFASLIGHLSITERLLEVGANPHALNQDWDTPLHFAVQKMDNVPLIEVLINAGANLEARNIYGYTVLHCATLSDDPEVIQFIVHETKKRVSISIHQSVNAANLDGETPLMLAIQRKKVNAIKKVIALGANLQLKNSEGKTALDLAMEPDNKEREITRRKEIIDLLYFANFNVDPTRSNTLKEAIAQFPIIVNEAMITHVLSLDLKDRKDSKGTKKLKYLLADIKRRRAVAIWSDISEAVKKELLTRFGAVFLIPGTEDTTPAFEQLLKIHPWIKLDKDLSNSLNDLKKFKEYWDLKSRFWTTVKVPTAQAASCDNTAAISSRIDKRAAVLCTREEEKYDPFVLFDEKENEGSVLMLAGADEIQRVNILRNLKNIYEIKHEGKINRSLNEQVKLQKFSAYIQALKEEQPSYLQEIKNKDQAQFIEIKNTKGDSIYLNIQREFSENKERMRVYCPQVNGHRALPIHPDITLPELLQRYAALLLPNEEWDELRISYYRFLETPSLYAHLDPMSQEDFRSDRQLLKDNNNQIEGLEISQVRAFFLIQDRVPDIEMLSKNFFKDNHLKITLRGDQFAQKLWQLKSEQQIALGKILNRYDIQKVACANSDLDLEAVGHITAFNQAIIAELKNTSIQNKAIDQDRFTQIGEQHIRAALTSKEFTPQEIDQVIANIKDLHGNVRSGLSKTIAYTRQGIFLAPAIMQAFNGDSRSLENLFLIMGSDITIDQAAQRLMAHPLFMRMFPKSTSILSKSIASPLGKILLLNGFFVSVKQMRESAPGSPERREAINLLVDNTVLFSSMVAEAFGLELGPVGILLDIGITIHQLITEANYLREKLPFKVSFWDSIALVLDFKKSWLEGQLTEAMLRTMQVDQIKQLEKIMGRNFCKALIALPLLTRKLLNINFEKLPKEIRDQIAKNKYLFIDTPEFSYQPSRPAVLEGGPVMDVYAPVYLEKYYVIAPYHRLQIILNATNGESFQENSIFLRTKEVEQGWSVVTSTMMQEGDKFPESPVNITGGLAGLIRKSNCTSDSSKNFIAVFNPCFGAMEIIGGPFLQEKSMYVLIQTLMLPNIVDPSFNIPVTQFTADHFKNYTNEITYIVGPNYHPSKIEAKDVSTVRIFFLPLNIPLEFHYLIKNMVEVTIDKGELQAGAIGPRFVLDDANELIISFPKEYIMSGSVQLNASSIQVEGLRSNDKNPVCFYVEKYQNLVVDVREGETNYYLEKNKQFQVYFKCDNTTVAQAPRVIKLQYTLFQIKLAQPLNDFSFNNSVLEFVSNTSIALSIRKYPSNDSVIVQGYYVLTDNRTQQAVYTLGDSVDLTVINVKDVYKFLSEENLFRTIASQGFLGFTLYNSTTKTEKWIAYDSKVQQFVYDEITYRLYKPHGLVAVKGRIIEDNIEDFSKSLVNIISVESNTSFPRWVSETAVRVKERLLVNIPLNARLLLTRQGILPLNLFSHQSKSELFALAQNPKVIEIKEAGLNDVNGWFYYLGGITSGVLMTAVGIIYLRRRINLIGFAVIPVAEAGFTRRETGRHELRLQAIMKRFWHCEWGVLGEQGLVVYCWSQAKEKALEIEIFDQQESAYYGREAIRRIEVKYNGALNEATVCWEQEGKEYCTEVGKPLFEAQISQHYSAALRSHLRERKYVEEAITRIKDSVVKEAVLMILEITKLGDLWQAYGFKVWEYNHPGVMSYQVIERMSEGRSKEGLCAFWIKACISHEKIQSKLPKRLVYPMILSAGLLAEVIQSCGEIGLLFSSLCRLTVQHVPYKMMRRCLGILQHAPLVYLALREADYLSFGIKLSALYALEILEYTGVPIGELLMEIVQGIFAWVGGNQLLSKVPEDPERIKVVQARQESSQARVECGQKVIEQAKKMSCQAGTVLYTLAKETAQSTFAFFRESVSEPFETFAREIVTPVHY